MKEEKSKSKRKLVYYLVLAVSVLLLVAATVLTVYFVTEDTNPVLDLPPVQEPDENPGTSGGEGPSEPSGGETVRFVAPVDSTSYTVEYSTIYANKVLGWYYRHKAIDFAANEGDAVRAMGDGTVETIAEVKETGKFIVINHGDDIRSVYRFVEVGDGLKVGDKVKQGEQIATVAAAYGIERHDGSHLHLEMTLKEKAVDPLDYLGAVLDEK